MFAQSTIIIIFLTLSSTSFIIKFYMGITINLSYPNGLAPPQQPWPETSVWIWGIFQWIPPCPVATSPGQFSANLIIFKKGKKKNRKSGVVGIKQGKLKSWKPQEVLSINICEFWGCWWWGQPGRALCSSKRSLFLSQEGRLPPWRHRALTEETGANLFLLLSVILTNTRIKIKEHLGSSGCWGVPILKNLFSSQKK